MFEARDVTLPPLATSPSTRRYLVNGSTAGGGLPVRHRLTSPYTSTLHPLTPNTFLVERGSRHHMENASVRVYKKYTRPTTQLCGRQVKGFAEIHT